MPRTGTWLRLVVPSWVLVCGHGRGPILPRGLPRMHTLQFAHPARVHTPHTCRISPCLQPLHAHRAPCVRPPPVRAGARHVPSRRVLFAQLGIAPAVLWESNNN